MSLPLLAMILRCRFSKVLFFVYLPGQFGQLGILKKFVYGISGGQDEAQSAVDKATPEYIVMKKRELCPENCRPDRCCLALLECLFSANCGVLINLDKETPFRQTGRFSALFLAMIATDRDNLSSIDNSRLHHSNFGKFKDAASIVASKVFYLFLWMNMIEKSPPIKYKRRNI